MCPRCGKPLEACICKQSQSRPKPDGIVRLQLQSKGRKGKPVTLVTGLAGSKEEITALAKEFKRRFGAGGAVKDGVIEIQGDHRDELLELLKAKGLKVKKAGG
jgi:translation initiation factor 1